MKRLLHLGGAPSQIPAIKYAVEAGYHVITCDYLPDNPGHKISHEYYNISTTDIKKVYELARSLNIDGVASHASDPSAPTVGYVAERLGLIGPGENASKILADKGLFRKMMGDCGLKTPEFRIFSKPGLAIRYLSDQQDPKIIKPVDSSGSKGIYSFTGTEDIEVIIQDTFRFSRKNEIIIEDFIPSTSTQIQGEGFVIDGTVRFTLYGDQKMSAYNPSVPASTSFPTRHSEEEVSLFNNLVKKAVEASGFKNGGLNIEIIEDTTGQFHLLELGPRNGGNFMPQLVYRSIGIDLVKMCIDCAMGNRVQCHPYEHIIPHAQLIIHSSVTGILETLEYSKDIEEHIVEEHIYKTKGDWINEYRGSQDVIGVSILDINGLGKSGDRYLNIEKFVKLKLNE